ncbi:DUF5668 domain-containing protein [Mucilaginibacter gynuensis]|uniref:DUF5668 domain-containing protein n=1 Tax=Mucilaginibacter gynuensis TaxID=1302236 RepID=A0ABP8HK48_9SPHI
MNNYIDKSKEPRNGKTIAGVILLVVGAVLLINQLNIVFFPGWLISWPMWLIIPGLYIGAKSNFKKNAWFILVLLGVVFLIDEATPHVNTGRVVWPLAFIAFGIWIILKRSQRSDNEKWKRFEESGKQPVDFNTPDPLVDYTVNDSSNATTGSSNFSTGEPQQPKNPFAGFTGTYNDDHLDTVAVFAGVDKIILSKDFKGGEVVNIFGGTELNLTKADINGRVVIELTQVFGSTKLIVPPHWHVISDMAAVFAGVDDKRMRHAGAISSEKVLILKGISIFAGVDIRSY